MTMDAVLKQRVITATVLIVFVLSAIYFANIWLLKSLILLLVVMAGIEWLQLIPMSQTLNKLIFIVGLLFSIYLSVFWLKYWLIAGVFLWGFILFAIISFPSSQSYWGKPTLVGAACLILLPLFANTLIAIYSEPQGQDLIVYLLCLVWATDSGAYLLGKRLGQNKLIPEVSPGKTIEGSIAGFAFAFVVAILGYVYFRPSHPMSWLIIAIFTAFISMIGDLFISMLKRRCKLKDTGNIFPGHGGVLDRIDSLIAASPIFYMGLIVLHVN